jgi:hypothetical protein
MFSNKARHFVVCISFFEDKIFSKNAPRKSMTSFFVNSGKFFFVVFHKRVMFYKSSGLRPPSPIELRTGSFSRE